MSGLDLDMIEARVRAATPGPWYQGRASRPFETDCDVFSGPDMDDAHDIATYCWSSADAALIANAPKDLSALVARVRELEATIERMRRARAQVPMPFCERDGKIVRDLLLKLNAAEAGERS